MAGILLLASSRVDPGHLLPSHQSESCPSLCWGLRIQHTCCVPMSSHAPSNPAPQRPMRLNSLMWPVLTLPQTPGQGKYGPEFKDSIDKGCVFLQLSCLYFLRICLKKNFHYRSLLPHTCAHAHTHNLRKNIVPWSPCSPTPNFYRVILVFFSVVLFLSKSQISDFTCKYFSLLSPAYIAWLFKKPNHTTLTTPTRLINNLLIIIIIVIHPSSVSPNCFTDVPKQLGSLNQGRIKVHLLRLADPFLSVFWSIIEPPLVFTVFICWRKSDHCPVKFSILYIWPLHLPCAVQHVPLFSIVPGN